MDLGVGRHEHPAGEVLGPDQCRHLLEVLGRADVLLGEAQAAVGPFGDRVRDRLGIRFGPGEVELQDLRHRQRILAGLARSFGELGEDAVDLLLRRADGDDPVRELARSPGGHRAGRGDVDRGRLLRQCPEAAGLHPEEAAVVLDLFAAEELGDDLDRLEHAVDALRHLRPVAGHDVLVERLTGAKTQPRSPRIHDLERGRGLGDDGGMHPERRTRHPGPQVAAGACPGDRQHLPYERGLALARDPRLEVVGGHDAREAGRIGPGAEIQDLGRPELLEHCRVADLRLGHLVSSASRSTGARRFCSDAA